MSSAWPRFAGRLSAAVKSLPEVVSATKFASRLDAALDHAATASAADLATLRAQPETVRTALTASMATTMLHTQSRIASHGGYGYYTIGPCGEELLSTLGLAARPTDPTGCTIGIWALSSPGSFSAALHCRTCC